MLLYRLFRLQVIVLCLTAVEVHSLSSQIPSQLIQCYSVEYEQEHVHYPPFEPRTLCALLRKLEHNKTEPNIRLLSNAILHVAKLDGIQHASVTGKTITNRVTLPYRASGPQFFKHRDLVDHFTTGQNAELQFPEGVLSGHELCLLHFLISDTVDLRYRGDESRTCSISFAKIPTSRSEKMVDIEPRHFVDATVQMSDCPELKGVMRTKWGDVSVGPLIAGIASAFERTGTDDDDPSGVDNVWMATLGGVLGHVVIKQASLQPKLLSKGKWNDTILPRAYYLNEDDWDVNNALLLGAIDGLILSSEVQSWYHAYPGASLSQIIATYYSARGVPYNPSFRACNRIERLTKLFDKYDFDKEVAAVAKQLNHVGTYRNSLDGDNLEGLVQAAVKQFKVAVDELLESSRSCVGGGEAGRQKRLEVIIIADQSYTPYQMELILAYLTEQADVSHYTSRIGLLSGSSGRWLVNITDDILNVYAAMSKINKNDWPTGLSLTPCLHQVIAHYQNTSGTPCTSHERPTGKVIVVLGQSSYLSDDDLASSIRSLDSIRGTYPETRLIIATGSEHAKVFSRLVPPQASDARSLLINSFDLRESIIKIGEALQDIPSSIINLYCAGSQVEFEEYITPMVVSHFELDEKYVNAKDITINLRSRSAVTACAYDARTPSEKTCRSSDEITFSARDFCAGEEAACALRLDVTTNDTAERCAAFACRYPDQVLINMRTSWTSASPTRQATSCSLLFLAACAAVYKQF